MIDVAVTLTSTASTTPSTNVPIIPSPCSNGGYLVDNICNCPSGFSGTFCEQKSGKLYFSFNIYYSLFLLRWSIM